MQKLLLRSRCLTKKWRAILNNKSALSATSLAPCRQKRNLTGDMSGQVLPHTHSHVVKSNEVAVGFELAEFERRRQAFWEQMAPGSFAIIPAAPKLYMTNDIPYPYRQNSDFYYLTGFMEPKACLIIEKDRKRSANYSLFVNSKNQQDEIWNGPRTGEEKAQQVFGVPTHSMQALGYKLNQIFSRFGSDFQQIYYQSNVNPDVDGEISKQLQNHVELTKNVKLFSSRAVISELRGIKSDAEVEMMRRAAKISAEAIIATMKSTMAGLSEGHIEAILEFEMRLRGAQRIAYPPVIASGIRANIIHYVLNNQVLKDGDLLLIDGGSEYYLYPSDISRTWPVSGKFTEPQRKIYEAVLRINKRCIELCGPSMTLGRLHDKSVEFTMEELNKLGIPAKSRSHVEIVYGHSIGHPLGMDIHEEHPQYPDLFVPGNMVTVEPGIYIPPHGFKVSSGNASDQKFVDSIPEEFRGIGVRIEDDILITKAGREVITKETPKEVDEIYEIMSQKATHPLAVYISNNYRH